MLYIVEIALAFENTAAESQSLDFEVLKLRPKVYSGKIKGGVPEAKSKAFVSTTKR